MKLDTFSVLLPLMRNGGAGSPSIGLTQCVLGGPKPTSVVRTEWHLDPSSRLAQHVGRKVRGCCAPVFGEGRCMGPHLTECHRGRGHTSVPSGNLIHPAVWPQQTWANNWEAVPLLGVGSPSDTMWRGPRPTSVPSGILIHAQPTPTSQTDRQDRTDRQVTTVR